MSGHNTGACAPISRGTSNSNRRGNTVARRQRREWLVEAYRADVVVVRAEYDDGSVDVRCSPFTPDPDCAALLDLLWSFDRSAERADRVLVTTPRRLLEARVVPACRCYRCGRLLTDDTVTVDRIFPGKLGGLYRTVRRDRREKVTNVRPACGDCNSATGGALADRPKRGRK